MIIDPEREKILDRATASRRAITAHLNECPICCPITDDDNVGFKVCIPLCSILKKLVDEDNEAVMAIFESPDTWMD